MSDTYIDTDTSEKIYKYKIILTKPDNIIASDIFSKIKYITLTDRRALICNTEKYIYNHIHLPFYEKKDIEEIIYKYGIQNAIQHFILNKKYYNIIREIVDNDESKIYIGIAFYILRECFEYRIVENV
jgi:hypothetical protein